MKKNFWESLDNFDQISVARKIRQPVYIIHGDSDPKISSTDAVKVYEAIGIKDKKLKIFAGGDHGFIDVSESMRKEFLNEVVEWFKRTI